MNRYVRYKRINVSFDYKNGIDKDNNIQEFLNDLIVGGYEIIYYNEVITKNEIKITTLCGVVR